MGNNKRSVARTFFIIFLAVILVAESAAVWNGPAYAASGRFAAPRLIKLQYYQRANGSYYAKLYWKAQKGKTYQIMRKKTGTSKWSSAGIVVADSTTGTFINERIGSSASYTYTVRRVTTKAGKIKKKGKYDKAGLKTIARPTMSVDFTNLHATIKWKKVSGADKYLIYRKIGEDDTNHLIASVASTKTSYTDIYAKSIKSNQRMAALITSDVFVDPSNNPISYTVRPYYSKKTGKKTKKESYGLYLRDGVIHLEPPTIVSLDESGNLKWGKVPLASGYEILRKDSGSDEWETLANIPADKETSKYQTAEIELGSRDAYYAVRAYARRNGKTQYSKYDGAFTLKNSSAGNDTNVLFFGDSMTFGSPYYGAQRGNFSYPHRIQALTGIRMFNPSIPAATLRYHSNKIRHRLVTEVGNMIALGETTGYAFGPLKVGENHQKFEDFDVVFIACGTNDYNDDTKTVLGSRETDWEKITNKTQDLSFTVNEGYDQAKTYTGMDYDYNIGTFDGAYNQVYKYIEEASVIRVMNGKPPIKVIPMSLFYSNRTSPFREIHNRNTTKNLLGYTMLDYQKELDTLNAKWAASPVLDIYPYNTQLEDIVNSKTCPYLASDNLHFTKYAYGLYGDRIADFMVKNDIFSKMSDAEIEALRESEEFKALLEKYSRSDEFVSRLNDSLLDMMNELLGIAEEAADEVIDEGTDVQEPVDDESGNDEILPADGEPEVQDPAAPEETEEQQDDDQEEPSEQETDTQIQDGSQTPEGDVPEDAENGTNP